MGPTTVATANVLSSLDRREAYAALAGVLAHEPDLVGLQEWYPPRLGLLRRTGPVAPLPPGRVLPWSHGAYVWAAPLLGGCAVGARADRFEPLSWRQVVLSRPGRADRGESRLGLEPARLATVAVLRDRHEDRTVCLVDYHLVSGVQAHDRYRPERPVLVGRHRREVTALERVVRRQQALGHVVYAVGDSNLHGLRLPGLTSAWEGRPDHPGTLGPRRRVDDVHGPGSAIQVTLVESASDHRAVVVRRSE